LYFAEQHVQGLRCVAVDIGTTINCDDFHCFVGWVEFRSTLQYEHFQKIVNPKIAQKNIKIAKGMEGKERGYAPSLLYSSYAFSICGTVTAPS
jgi:hypothetical protein